MGKDFWNFSRCTRVQLRLKWYIIYNIRIPGDAKVTMIYIFESESQGGKKKKSYTLENKRSARISHEKWFWKKILSVFFSSRRIGYHLHYTTVRFPFKNVPQRFCFLTPSLHCIWHLVSTIYDVTSCYFLQLTVLQSYFEGDSDDKRLDKILCHLRYIPLPLSHVTQI